MRSAQPLDGIVSSPACFQEVMDAATLVGAAQVSVVAPARSTRITEDENAFLIIEKRLGFSQVSGGRTVAGE